VVRKVIRTDPFGVTATTSWGKPEDLNGLLNGEVTAPDAGVLYRTDGVGLLATDHTKAA
jgi:hypothetical protein